MRKCLPGFLFCLVSEVAMADKKIEIWQCPVCGTQLDISGLGFYESVTCTGCGLTEIVHTVISGCKVEGVLGVGGMSVVLRARDLVLNRYVAIKLLNEAYRSQPERMARFENESAMMAKVRHDNVVSVYSAGHARNQFYIVMELVNGRDLDSIVEEVGPLSPLRAVEYTTQAVLGLQAAYNAGLLHRDMKPGNIIIDSSGCAKVLDFGLALGKHQEDTEELIWATPYYVPPETLERREEDARTDIYALGMTLRYLLTGIGSFASSTNSIDELLAYKEKLSPLAEILPEANESLCDLVDHMTAFEPQKRPANYPDLLAELEAVRSALLSDEAEKTPEKRRAHILRSLIYTGVTLSIALAVAAVTAYFFIPAPKQAYIAPVSRSASRNLLLQQAEQALNNRDFKLAYEQFRQLMAGTHEPALLAWSALHAACLADMLNLPTAQADYENFTRLAGAKGSSPAARKIVADFNRIVAKDSGEGLQSPYLKTLQLCKTARPLFASGASREAERYMAAADVARRNLSGPYAVFYNAYAEQVRKAGVAFESESYKQALQALQAHRLAEGRNRLQTMRNMPQLSQARKTEIGVLLEVCDVADAAFAMLRRRCGNRYAPGCSPEKVAELAAGLNQGALASELPVLCYMLAGNYQKAAALNPYRNKADSSAPFALIMKDWLQRLGY